MTDTPTTQPLPVSLEEAFGGFGEQLSTLRERLEGPGKDELLVTNVAALNDWWQAFLLLPPKLDDPEQRARALEQAPSLAWEASPAEEVGRIAVSRDDRDRLLPPLRELTKRIARADFVVRRLDDESVRETLADLFARVDACVAETVRALEEPLPETAQAAKELSPEMGGPLRRRRSAAPYWAGLAALVAIGTVVWRRTRSRR